MHTRRLQLSAGLAVALCACGAPRVTSYAIVAKDAPGSSTGTAAAALGRPDYRFVNDAALPFGGTSASVFDVGESSTFTFPRSLRNIPGANDLVLSAYVGGLGETDSAEVLVEISSDGVSFAPIGTFDTASGRTTYPFAQERNFAGVKHFALDFGTADLVTHVRLTNQDGSSEGLRLDALEGLHPVSQATHAFEIRFERYRDDSSERFLVRIKNIADPGGAAIRSFRMSKPPETTEWLQDTDNPFLGTSGDFICTDGCVDDGDQGAGTWASTWTWSLDGVTPAPASAGMPAGELAAHLRHQNVDIDTGALAYLSGFSFEVTFADGYVHPFTYDGSVLGQAIRGQLYQKYTYFSSTPALSGPRPVDYYEFRRAPAAP